MSLLDYIEMEIAKVGSPLILADMIMAENAEIFKSGFQSHQAEVRLVQRGIFNYGKFRARTGRKYPGKWRSIEEKYLKDNHMQPLSQLASALGRSRAAVKNRLRVVRSEFNLPVRYRAWTPSEDAFVIGNYQQKSDKEIGIALNRTAQAILHRRYELRCLRRITEQQRSA